MAERLGLAVIPGIGWRASEVQAIAREAEDAGFDAIFADEANNDVRRGSIVVGRKRRDSAGSISRWDFRPSLAMT